MQSRIKFLIELKRHSGVEVSKRALMEATGLCSYSVHKWRTLYHTGGVALLLQHNKKGFKPRKITAEQHIELEKKLTNPENGLRGYKELQQWVKKEFKNDILYNTLLKYCVKHFGSKVKVARKYHAKKDDTKVETFKKTLVKSAKKQ